MRANLRILVRDAVGVLAARPGRSALTALGTIIGVGALVATVGFATTVRSQVSNQFNGLESTEVTVQDAQPNSTTAAFPPDAATIADALPGVTASGLYWTLDSATTVTTLPAPKASTAQVSVLAAGPGAFGVIHPTLSFGRVFNPFDNRSDQRVALIGQGAASQLGIDADRPSQAIFIGGIPFSVVGIIKSVARQPESLLSVVIPVATATAIWGPPQESPEQMIIQTRPGAAQVVGSEVAAALRPSDQSRLVALVPPDPAELRQSVNGDLTLLFVILGGVALLVGFVGITNSTLVAVLERVPEIGLRRAIGAQRREVALQFLIESGLIGSVAGLVGAAAGVICVVALSLTQGWTAVLPATVVLLSPLVGTVVGVLAGAYPAWRASRMEPVEALRR
ncbi:MAG: ABC transporter permease [Acidimicrobiales bacterium]